MHTDIKPENVLIESMDNIASGIRLIDLGGVHKLEDPSDGCIQTR